MKIGILGTRGIPNHYGGFEQFAQFLSAGLVERGHEVVVYNSSDHPFQEKEWNGVRIQHCKDWEGKIGTTGQFIYDFNCIVNSRKQDFDILLQLGYTSSSVWRKMLPSKTKIVTNMDGLEWERSKFSKLVQLFLKKAEKWAVESSDCLVADSKGIKSHLERSFGAESTYIAYGSDLFNEPDALCLDDYQLEVGKYNMLIARMEPENNIETILDGVVKSNSAVPFIVVGKTDNEFGGYLKNKFSQNTNIKFVGGIYSLEILNNLRHYSNLYFHGHSVGGTNPSLLEAMASSAFVVAHKNEFNGAILEEDALYFSSATEVQAILNEPINPTWKAKAIANNRTKIEQFFSWETIIQAYEDLFLKLAATN